jgi:hypothetical protein
MIILGIVLLVIGLIIGSGILTTLGIILLVIGAILAILGSMGRAVGGRRHYFSPRRSPQRHVFSRRPVRPARTGLRPRTDLPSARWR